ncbi:exodeoxyribonuclease VII small subunit [Candidatus Saccharibacteria bacterium]|nr:exodeoxyribonuclease VII small subunit [Candidatus Saccharibacteria bacterium]
MTNTKESINDKISRLNTQVEWFYGDDFALDEAGEKYKAAIELAKEIEKDLDELKNEIEVISKDFTKE